MSENLSTVQRPDRHLALVASAEVTAINAGQAEDHLTTTTRCRPSELPTTIELRLTTSSMRRATIKACAADLDLPTWTRLAVEAARQAARAASLLDMRLDNLVDALDAAAVVPVAATLATAAPMTAYMRALRDRGRRIAAPTDGGESLIVHVSDELAVAWTTEAIEASESLDAWASRQLELAPSDVVAWELAAARRGAYLGEWVLAAAAAAKRASARPHA